MLLAGVLAGTLAAPAWRGATSSLVPTDDATAAAAAAAALRRCSSLECLRRVHDMPGQRQFEFPHFLIIGWAKCGTTSLYK